MTEYLEKAALVRILRAKAEIGRLSEYSVCFDNVAKMIELLPAADVAEVKHGKWIEVQKENIWNDIVPVLECSALSLIHIYPTAQKWVGALHGVNLLKRRKTIKEDKHMSPEMTVAFIVLAVWSAVFTAAYIGERYRNRKLRQALKNKGRYARYKESRSAL